MTKRKSFLVTGGSGFIGAALTHRLVKDGHDVRVLDDGSRGRSARLEAIRAKIKLFDGDVRDPHAVRKAVAGVDCVCHLAYVNGTRFFYEKPELVLDVGVKGMINVLDACIAEKVPELVLASSSEVYQSAPAVPTDEKVALSIPDPLNPRYSYGAGKIISEMMAIHYGKAHFKRSVIFRPHNVFGPDMGWEHVIPEFLVKILKAPASKSASGEVELKIQGTGDETRSFIFIDDFIDGLACVIERGEHLGIYHIGTAEELSIREVAHAVAEALGKKIRIIPGKLAAGGTLRRCPDISKLERLGFQPKYRLRAALPAVARWYAEHLDQMPGET